MGFTPITVTETYELATGVAPPSDPALPSSRRSRVRFTPSAPMINDGVTVQAPVIALLDSTGAMFITLNANTDPDTIPNDTDGDAFASYYVEEFVEGAVVARYYVQIPHDALGGTVVLSSLNRLVEPPVVTYPAPGPTGDTGPMGPAGPGVPAGGTTGQFLRKTSATDYATNWQTLAAVATSGSATDLTIGTLDEARMPASFITDSEVSALISAAINDLIDGAPGTIDTLNELAAALGDDPNFSATVNAALAARAMSSLTLTAGTGLTGGGDLTANRSFAVSYGTTAGTAAQGNDSRITGAAQKASNLSDLASASTARTNLGLVAVASSGSASDLTSGTLSNARLPRVLSPVTATTGVTGAQSTDAATAGNFLNWTMTGNATLNAPTNPTDGQILHLRALASGATRTITLGSGVQNASGATFPLSVSSGKVGRVALEYMGLISAWVVTAAVVTP